MTLTNLMKYTTLIYPKILFALIFNTTLFLILFVSIQNNSKKSEINFLINETIRLPISFIIGGSFISGSISGSLLSLISLKKER